MIIPSVVYNIQLILSQLWNCNEIRFETNGNWFKVVLNLNSHTSHKVRNTQTGQRAPFCCTLLVFTWSYDQLFLFLILIHYLDEYTQNLHNNIPYDWFVCHAPSVNINRKVCHKYMSYLILLCIYSPANHQVVFFDGRYGRFNDS